MPSGRTHTRLNLVAFPVLLFFLIAYGFTGAGFLLPFAGGFMAGTYLLSPDLDTNSAPYRKWGLLRIFWYPYKAIMPHRSILTHTIILGDIIRLLYLTLVISPLLYILNKMVLDGQLIPIVREHRDVLFVLVLGVIAASTLHIAADVLNTQRKRLFRGRKRRR
ncbi:MAG: metal-binding protein [Ectobacillus sp.]